MITDAVINALDQLDKGGIVSPIASKEDDDSRTYPVSHCVEDRDHASHVRNREDRVEELALLPVMIPCAGRVSASGSL